MPTGIMSWVRRRLEQTTAAYSENTDRQQAYLLYHNWQKANWHNDDESST